MKTDSPSKASIGRLLTRVAALVISRLRGADLRRELNRLEALSKPRAFAEIGGVIGALFALALLAASFGVWGLLAYFAAVLVLFR